MTDDELDNLTLACVPIDHDLAKAGRRYPGGTLPQSPYDRLWKIMRSAAKKVNALPERDQRKLERMCTLTIVFGPDPDATIDAAIKKALSSQMTDDTDPTFNAGDKVVCIDAQRSELVEGAHYTLDRPSNFVPGNWWLVGRDLGTFSAACFRLLQK